MANHQSSPAGFVQDGQGQAIGMPAGEPLRHAHAIGRARILFPFADRPRSVGGSHISAGALIENIDRDRFEPTVLLLNEPGALTEFFAEKGVRTKRMPGGLVNTGSVPGMIGAIARAARYLSNERFDFVHTNEGAMHAMWGIAARLTGTRQIWHHRGNPGAKGVSWLAPVTAAKVLTVSRYAAPSPGVYSAAGRVTVAHSPFDLSLADMDRDECRADALAELDVPYDTKLIGYFGHFSERKRPVLFIETLAELKKANPGQRILGLMFGEEHDRGMLARMTAAIERHGLQDSIRLMGFRKPATPWMAACDATLVTAVEEPFGRTLIEAMLLGTPVVAAASGGNLEAIEDGSTGLLATADDPAALADAMSRMLGDHELAWAISDTARKDALARFGVETHVRTVQAVYDALLHTGRAA
ncbi:glycosyltransferase [Aurantiacibacter poecillastricola]|uniref:glycosyltransferase n=1 Tax=Aurantiacibacter poecillastricola TaxID=3064385 RepID=UPI00273ECD48|nr:glycosyltransferase [Aurantiacibacter sp. 219JJ12-13]MDP5259997.1 glycosyltransferase [Aurantiacibacter sp. 219JJ12-13]